MANPSIANVTAIYGNTTYLVPSNAGVATVWSGLTPAANSVNRIFSITCSNVSGTLPISVLLKINSSSTGNGASYSLAPTVVVPVSSTVLLVDKYTNLYINENQSLVVTVNPTGQLELVASYETLS